MFEDPLEKEEEKTVPHHINDSEARDLLRKLCSDSNICAIQTFQRKERNSILESALRRGLGVRQLARLTGVSYGIIQRINEKVGQSPLTQIAPHSKESRGGEFAPDGRRFLSSTTIAGRHR